MAIGEAFLSAFLQVLFDRLASKDVVNFFHGHGLENCLKKLKMAVRNLESFLNDAENKQFENSAVKEWLAELKDAYYDAEDVLDELATEALRIKLEVADQQSQTILDQVWKYVPNSLNPTVRQLVSNIHAITGRFDELEEKRNKLGLEEIAAERTSATARLRETSSRESSSVVDDTRVYGRDDDKEKIVNLLLKYDSACDYEISVIPIVGMGGVGKTTLAQIVYNDLRVERQFDLKAWVCISEDFDVKRITKLILESLGKGSNFSSLSQVQEELQKALRDQKFLIVLDDVWSKNHVDWVCLQNPFQVGASGSKIILTTRNKEIALKKGTVDAFTLRHLSDDDCWLVFACHAFLNKKHVHTKEGLVEIGKKIVAKCKGSPLAAKCLGGILRSKLSKDAWEDIFNSNKWDFPVEENDILPALLLSYYDLPSHLKRCFAYCSIFPKDYEFEEEKLVLLWMAEGFLEQINERKHMEDLGVEYFRDLVSRSFFQLSSNNRSFFVMHDLIHDLARWVAGETSFGLEGEKQFKMQRVRHSSYGIGNYDGYQKFEPFEGAKHIRTFLQLPLMEFSISFITNNVPLMLVQKFRCLRVLSLRGYYNIRLCSSIGELKHLRYLDFSGTSIVCLPESTSTLYNLQTLLLERCFKLKMLPAEMQNLINLRYLNTRGAYSIEKMPAQLGKLRNLRELSNFIVGNNYGSSIKQLMNLKHLKGTLCISRLENEFDVRGAKECILKDKRNLEALTVEWSSRVEGSRRNKEVEKVVLNMLQPPNLLKELTVKYYSGIEFPAWLEDPSFSEMTRLTLVGCVNLILLPPLGQLPSLKELCIKECPELVGSGTSPNHVCSLENLIIEKCPQLVISISSLPNSCKFNRKEGEEIVERSSVGLSLTFCDKSNIMRLTKGVFKGVTNVGALGIVGYNELTSSLWLGLLQLLELHECVGLKKLEGLSMEGISSVSLVTQELEQDGLHCRLENLSIKGCIHLENLGGLRSFKALTVLLIQGCPSLVSFPEAGLPPTLKRLLVHDCSALSSVLNEAMMMHTSLAALLVRGCPSLTSLSSSRGGELPATLKYFDIRNCLMLESVVESVHNNTSLEWVLICSCERLKSLPEGLHNLIHLRGFTLQMCPNIVSFPEGGLPTTNLINLDICNCEKLVTLPGNIHNLTSLEELSICEYPGIILFREKGIPTANLRKLVFKNNLCKSLLEWGLHKLTCLRELEIGGCPDVLSFPDQMLPISLTKLVIREFPNLECLSSKGFKNLSSHEHMWIIACPKLKSLPEDGLPSSLLSLRMWKCPLLEQRYKEDGGRDWHTISHIPCVEF